MNALSCPCRPSRGQLAVLAAIVAVVPVMTVTSLSVKSAAFDEPAHLVHGLAYVDRGDFGVGVDHPPLARFLAAAAVRLAGVPVNYEPGDIPWTPAHLTAGAQRVLYLKNDADRLLFWGRLPFTLLHMILVVIVFRFALSCWGPFGALVSAFLCAFSPSVLAHSRLITSDFSLAVLVFTANAFLYAAARRLTLARLTLAGGALGLALLCKQSALICMPIFLVLLLARALSRRAWPAAWPFPGTGSGREGRPKRLTAAALGFVWLCGVATGSVWAFYGFRYHAWPAADPQARAKAAVQEVFRARNTPESETARAALALMEQYRVLPEPYLLGLRFTWKHMEHRLSYFWGSRSIEGNVWYFPTALALKTPLALLFLCAGVGIALARKRLALPPASAWFVFTLPALYFASTLESHLNLGHRHLLPVYPFLFVLAGGAARWLRPPPRTRPFLLAGALLWYGAASIYIYPDYLTYFNEVAGGPRGGMKFFGDSSLDWGQDLKRLRPWMEEHGVRHIKLGYFGTALPQYYGLSFEWLPSVGFLNDQPGTRLIREGDYLAVSATCLQGFYFDDMNRYAFLKEFEPVDNIGHTLYIYHIERGRLRAPG